MADKKQGPHGEGCECPWDPRERLVENVKKAAEQADSFHRLCEWAVAVHERHSRHHRLIDWLEDVGISLDDFTNASYVAMTVIKKGPEIIAVDTINQLLLLGMAMGVASTKKAYITENLKEENNPPRRP